MKILKDSFDLPRFYKSIYGGSLLMIDYDGTLAPLINERMQAYPYAGVKERLCALMALKNVRLVIVSGRSMSILETLIDMPAGLEMWGSHGMERKLANGKVISAEIPLVLREGLDKGLNFFRENVDPKLYDIKPFSVSLHWRSVSPKERMQLNEFKKSFEEITANYEIEIHDFDGGFELRPKNRGKGNVVNTLLSEMPKETAAAFLGDDFTDEEAFITLGDRGLKVLIREEIRETNADIYLTPPSELLSFLDLWISKSQIHLE